MLAKGLVLRIVAGSGGWTPRRRDEKLGSESVTRTSIFLLSEAQIQVFETKPAPGPLGAVYGRVPDYSP